MTHASEGEQSFAGILVPLLICLFNKMSGYGCHVWELFFFFLGSDPTISPSVGSRQWSSLWLCWVVRDSSSATSPFPHGPSVSGHSGPEGIFKMRSRAESPSFWTEPRVQSLFSCPDWYLGQQLILIHFLCPVVLLQAEGGPTEPCGSWIPG